MILFSIVLHMFHIGFLFVKMKTRAFWPWLQWFVNIFSLKQSISRFALPFIYCNEIQMNCRNFIILFSSSKLLFAFNLLSLSGECNTWQLINLQKVILNSFALCHKSRPNIHSYDPTLIVYCNNFTGWWTRQFQIFISLWQK